MLESLDDVAWERFECFSDNGEHVNIPGVIRSLSSEDETARREAFRLIVFCTCTNYEYIQDVASTVIPFLVELLGHDLPIRRDIMTLLEAIVSDSSSSSLFSTKLDAKESARRGVPTYINLLHDKDEKLRNLSCRILRWFREDAEVLAPLLLRHLTSETVYQNRFDAIWSIGDHVSMNSTSSQETKVNISKDLLIQWEAANDGTIKLALGISIVQILGKDAPASIFTEIVENLANADVFLKYASWGSSIGGHLIAILAKLEREQAITGLAQALKLTSFPSDTDLFGIDTIALALLNLAFNYGHPRHHLVSASRDENGVVLKEYIFLDNGDQSRVSPESLLPIQRSTLQAIVESDRYWRIKTNLLAAYGLPETREGLIQLLSGTTS